MGQLSGAILSAAEVDEELARSWDAMVPSRGSHADVLDSHAWYGAWLAAVPPATADRVRLAVVRDDGEPAALLLLVGRRGSYSLLGGRTHPRARPVVRGEDPPPAVLEELAATLARGGVRRLSLPGLPGRDPATAALLSGLRGAGYHLITREVSGDRLAPALHGWEAYRRELAGFERYARRFANRLQAQWDVVLDRYGTPEGGPVAEGFAIFEELQRRSWKNDFTPEARRHWSAMFDATDREGWIRVYVLRVGGVAAAVHVWFRVGEVATWYASAYDQRLAVLSPGTVVQWWSQQRLFAEAEPPTLVDLMPGTTAEKERISPVRPPMLMVEAALGRGPWTPRAHRLGLRSRQLVTAARTTVRQRRRASAGPPSAAAEPITADVAVPPGGGPTTAVELDAADPAVRRALAATTGWSGTQAMAEAWREGDTWWAVGDVPVALLRLAVGDRVVEVARLPGEHRDAVELAALLAGHLGRPLALAGDAPVHEGPLPWPTRRPR